MTKINWEAIGVAFCALGVAYNLTIGNVEADVEKNSVLISKLVGQVQAMQIEQAKAGVRVESLTESIDRLNLTLEKLEDKLD